MDMLEVAEEGARRPSRITFELVDSAMFITFTAYCFFVRTCVACFTTANPPVPRTFPNLKSFRIDVEMPPVRAS